MKVPGHTRAQTRIVDGPTVREQIANGPHFDPEPGTCLACGGFGEEEPATVDKSTGLSALCWRAWRWSAVQETQTQRTETVR